MINRPRATTADPNSKQVSHRAPDNAYQQSSITGADRPFTSKISHVNLIPEGVEMCHINLYKKETEQ